MKKFDGCFKFMFLLIIILVSPGCQAQEKQPVVAPKGLQQPAAVVYINGSKYRLIQRHSQYWLLTDLQNSQKLRLTNQLVVSGIHSADELRSRLNITSAFAIKPIADGVMSVSGPITQLMQLEPQLRKLAGVQTEWQLFYLPLKSQSEN